MRKKPKGGRYRNLYPRGEVIFYGRVVSGKRIRVSTGTSDWQEAARWRDDYERRNHVGEAGFSVAEVPRFAAFSERFLTEDVSHLAASTRKDRKSHLRVGGPLLDYFAPGTFTNPSKATSYQGLLNA